MRLNFLFFFLFFSFFLPLKKTNHKMQASKTQLKRNENLQPHANGRALSLSFCLLLTCCRTSACVFVHHQGPPTSRQASGSRAGRSLGQSLESLIVSHSIDVSVQ